MKFLHRAFPFHLRAATPPAGLPPPGQPGNFERITR